MRGDRAKPRADYRRITATVGLFLLIAFSTTIEIAQADAASVGEIDASVNFTKAGNFDVHMTWTKESSKKSKISKADWTMTISSPESGKLKAEDVYISATFTEEGIEWLSEEKKMGVSLINLLQVVDEDLVEIFLLNDWEGKLISEIKWARKPLDLIPPAFSEQLLGLKIEKINCTELTWAEPDLEIGLKLTLTGDLVNNEGSVGYPGVALEGSFEVSEASWSQTVDASFQITEEGSWDFTIPHIRSIYGSQDHENLVDELSGGEVEFTVDLIPEADMSGLPEGYQKTDPSYVWTGDVAADILATLLTGKGGYSIVIPPSGGTEGGVPEDKFLYGIVIAMAAVLVILIGVLFWKGRGVRS